MNTYTKYIFGVLIGGIFIATSFVTAQNLLKNFTFKNNDATCGSATCKDEDIWKYTVEDILIFDSDRDSYQKQNYRGLLQGTITSNLFGIFTMNSEDSGEKGLILTDIGPDGVCKKGHTYSITGSIISETFGIMNVAQDKSYFCPNSLETFIVFSSHRLPKKILYNLGLSDIEEENLEKSMNVIFNGTLTSNIFEKQQVIILGVTSGGGDISTLFNESGNRGINEINSSKGVISVLGDEINRRISQLTRNAPSSTQKTKDENISSFNESDSMVRVGNENIFYFNYEGQEKTGTNDLNKGHIVTIVGKNPSFDGEHIDRYQVGINGKNTLVVKGGNVYIKSDIYNQDDESLLTIVSRRDGDNRGGNIYVDPDVTNIDAILIADGSLLSYRKNKTKDGVLNRNINNNEGLLARQLYIYGMLFTKNTIGSNKIPYGSDHSILKSKQSFQTKSENPYDLANIRAFQPRFAATGATIEECGGGIETGYWTAGYIEDTTGQEKLKKVKQYAWAGKMKCFNRKVNTEIKQTDSEAWKVSKKDSNLRNTDKQNSLIIQHNPTIQKLAPYLLRQQ